jgi:CRP-like cAMP-binding protein
VTRSRLISQFPIQEPTPADRRARNRLLQALPQADFEALRPHLQSVEMVKETVLLEAGAPLTHLYLPESGIVSMMVRLSEGQTIELAMIGRDSILGASAAFGDAISLSEAIVLQPGSAVVLDIASYRAAADRSAAFRSLLARHEQALLAETQQSAACNATHSVEARLSRWLLRARELCGGEALPLTQELLARMIGVQRNAISIVAHGLQQAGVIGYNRGHMEIYDPQGLEETSCECFRVVKAHRDRLLQLTDQPPHGYRQAITDR